MLLIEKKVKILSDLIAERSLIESECQPIDRHFLQQYITEILNLDRNSFLLYNLEKVNSTYTEYLLLCLPELWEDITVEDLIIIIRNFTNPFSFFVLILFTYKYIEINIIQLIFSIESIPFETKEKIKEYLNSQYPNLIKAEGEIFVIDESLIGVSNTEWMYIKQRLLLDKRIKPALNSLSELKDFIETL
jgi:hypothetical protein